jgi:hypothetical protein
MGCVKESGWTKERLQIKERWVWVKNLFKKERRG